MNVNGITLLLLLQLVLPTTVVMTSEILLMMVEEEKKPACAYLYFSLNAKQFLLSLHLLALCFFFFFHP